MSHRVHGLSGDVHRAGLAAPGPRRDRSPCWTGYALGTVRGTPWRSPRPLSAAVVVETDAARVFVKRHHRGVRDSDTLAEEHRFMAHLRGARHSGAGRAGHPRRGRLAGHRGPGLRGPRRRHAGGTCIATPPPGRPWSGSIMRAPPAPCWLACTAPPPGTTRRSAPPTSWSRATTCCARTIPWPRWKASCPGARDWPPTSPDRDWRGDLARSILPRQQRLQAAPRAGNRACGRTTTGTPPTCAGTRRRRRCRDVLDFGLASPTFALFDLATAIERNAVAWLELRARRRRRARGHGAGADRRLPRSARRSTPADLDVLAGLLPLVHLDFALSETEYFHAITARHVRDADLAYDAFLLGHARLVRQHAGPHAAGGHPRPGLSGPARRDARSVFQ